MIPDPFIQERSGADALREGYFLLRRAKAKVIDIPVRIWFGPPEDPETGQPLDRSWRWQIQVGFFLLEETPMRVGGIWIDNLDDIWPRCAGVEIDAVEWKYRIERADWAANNDETDPFAEMGGRVDPMTCALP